MVEVQSESGSGPGVSSQKGLVAWFRKKWGRFVTAIGSVFLSIDVFDVGPARQPLADLIGEDKAKKLIGAVALVCLVLSFVRHQQIANRAGKSP